MVTRWFNAAFAALAICLLAVETAPAQNRFTPVLQVGDTVITQYQIDQRARFLGILGAPGDPRDLAREQLINEAVQMAAAEDNGVEPSADEVEQGIAEFASRANLTADQFLTALGQEGISAATFRDFITAGVVWRATVRERFGDETRGSITQAQIQRALARTGTEGGLRVLLSEILLPRTTPETLRASRERAAQLSSSVTSEADFAAAARAFSVSPSASRGGEVNWLALEGLPPEVQPIVRNMTPGQISRPVELATSIAIFFLRDVERVAAGTPDTLSVDYALFIAGDTAEANRVADQIDVCDDLYGVAKGLPEERLIRETQPAAQLPADIRAAITDLDNNESTTALTRGGAATVLMLCERKPSLESTVDADIIANRLLNARLGTTAVHYLSELRAATTVVDLTQ